MQDPAGERPEDATGIPVKRENGMEAERFPRRVLVRDRGTIFIVNMDHIRWVGAQGAYVSLHTVERTYLLRMCIGKFEALLPPEKFARIHRSAIVNLDSVSRLLTLAFGKCAVVLDDNTRLVMSRSFRESLLRRFVSVGAGT